MRETARIPSSLFVDGHYLGRPADFEDRIVARRVRLSLQVDNFVGKTYALLDIGCGNGASMLALAPYMRSCTGIDVVDAHREAFVAACRDRDISNCSFERLNIEQDTLRTQYDRLISFEVVEHLRSEESLRHYYEVLRPGGIALLSVPNKWWIFETHGAKLPLLPWNRVPFFSWLPQPLHARWANARIYTKGRIGRVLRRVGFERLRMHYVTAPMDVLPEGWLRQQLIRYVFRTDTTKVPFLATAIFVTAHKPSF